MLDFPIVDSHLHLWDPKNIHYPWLQDNSFLNKAFLLEDYNKACGDIQVEKMVFVQCECSQTQYMEEARWVTELAKLDSRIQAIIPWVPLEKGEGVRSDLEELSQNRLVKGIRRIIEFEKDMDFCLLPEFVKGVQLLPEYNYSFDINIAHHQMTNTLKFAQQCPEVKFILDHAGKPCIKYNILDSWKKNIKEFSEMTNVSCKMSGLVTEADYNNWTLEELKPYIYHVIDCFGIDRVIFAGDWPVVTQASEYSRWVAALFTALDNLSKAELHKLFYSNAVAFYKL